MLTKAAGSCAPWWKQGREPSCCRAPRLRLRLKHRVFGWGRKAAHGQRGFLLLEYVFSLAAGAVLAALVCTGLGRTALSWQRLQEQLVLQQAGGYMQSLLERQLGYNATAVRIQSTGDLELDTIMGNKKLLLYCRNGGLYLQTTTGNGKGTNPLFMAGMEVSQWQATKLSGNSLRISFTLTNAQGGLRSKGAQRQWEQIYYCYNGEVFDEEG